MALDGWYRSLSLPLPRRSLDLACGSGEATLALEAWLQNLDAEGTVVDAADPYTFEVRSFWWACIYNIYIYIYKLHISRYVYLYKYMMIYVHTVYIYIEV